jgi:hypothetical protein
MVCGDWKELLRQLCTVIWHFKEIILNLLWNNVLATLLKFCFTISIGKESREVVAQGLL